MRAPACCQPAQPSADSPHPRSILRRGTTAFGWAGPGALLLLLPKCPACIAAYVLLFTGASVSFAVAERLRLAVLVLSVAILTSLALKRLLPRAAI
jgi:hypothetical protein